MLCRIPGNFNIVMLGFIKVLEGNIQMYMKLIWDKQLTHNTIKHDLLLSKQFENKPSVYGSSAPSFKLLSFDLISLLKTLSIVFNNNTIACYDKIIANFSQLCCCKLILFFESTGFVLNILFQAKYHIITCYGISNNFYMNLNSTVCKVLQDSRLVLAIWCVVSLPLISTYDIKFLEAGIPNPTNTQFI